MTARRKGTAVEVPLPAVDVVDFEGMTTDGRIFLRGGLAIEECRVRWRRPHPVYL